MEALKACYICNTIDDKMVHYLAEYLFPYGIVPIECVFAVLTESDDAELKPLNKVQDLVYESQSDLTTIQEEFAANGWLDESYDGDVSPHLWGSAAPGSGAVAKKDPLTNITNVHRERRSLYSGKRIQSNHEKKSSNMQHCVFCFNNGNNKAIYQSHLCRDKDGLVSCPFLMTIVCPHCKATGQYAHTPKYCPSKPIITPEDCKAMEEKFRKRKMRSTEMQKNYYCSHQKPVLFNRAFKQRQESKVQHSVRM